MRRPAGRTQGLSMAQRDDIHELARGRWRGILLAAGIKAEFLTGHHTGCPTCGGKDRFRWDNKEGSGSSFCNGCGAKSGVDMVMAAMNMPFIEAKKWILAEIGKAPVEAPKARRDNESGKRWLSKLWSESSRLCGTDAASLYLQQRGIIMGEPPTQLRYHARVGYRRDDGTITHHPAMLAKFVSPDAKAWTLHLTYLDGKGGKADVPKAKKLAPVAVPGGGAVRLANSAETMGISTGIETSMSAALLHDVPVWAALTDGLLVKWEPPEKAKCILVFGDPDSNFSGHAASYALAHRLALKKYHVEVRMPPDVDVDWNDLQMMAAKEFA